jgi:hypothetical protein
MGSPTAAPDLRLRSDGRDGRLRSGVERSSVVAGWEGRDRVDVTL